MKRIFFEVFFSCWIVLKLLLSQADPAARKIRRPARPQHPIARALAARASQKKRRCQ